MKWFRSLIIVGLIVVLSGCCCGGGTDTNTTVVEKQPVNVTPLGDELIKLKEARDKGALTDKEYEEQKTKLLKGE